MSVEGSVAPGFEAVRDAFAQNFEDGLDIGAAVAVYKDGRALVDLVGGTRDKAGTIPWSPDTLVNVWSTTKGVAALAVAMLVDRGQLDYAAPVAKYWPEFAAGGKQDITVEMMLSHQSGLNGTPEKLTLQDLYDWDPYVRAFQDMAPLWEPGSKGVYHGISYGHLAGELLKRVDGRTIDRFIAEEITEPHGLDFHLGLDESDEGRVAEIVASDGANQARAALAENPEAARLMNPPIHAELPNERDWRAAVIPGANGQSNASALAQLYAMLAAPENPFLSDDALKKATVERFRGHDNLNDFSIAFAAGFMLSHEGQLGPNERNFGHTGWGGSYAFSDPDKGMGISFTMNHMLVSGTDSDPRKDRLIKTIYDCLKTG